MRSFNGTTVLAMVGLALGLAACASNVEVETREKQSAGALEQNNSANGCVTGDIQRATCVDPGELKLEAYNICLQTNTMLTDLQFPAWCADGLADSAQYTCCAAPPPAPPPPPPSQPNAGCVFEFIGDGQTCQNMGDIKLPAYEACNAAGLQLMNLFVQDQGSCNPGDGVNLGYECCPIPPPPPPPSQPNPGCVFEFIGDGQTCQNLGDVKLSAYEACNAAGQQLTNLFVQDQGSCNPGDGVNLGYECCPAPPPPPPPVVCLSGSLGDGQSCLDLGDIKTSAWAACEQAGLILFDLQITDFGSCGPSEAVLATYQCVAADYGACP